MIDRNFFRHSIALTLLAFVPWAVVGGLVVLVFLQEIRPEPRPALPQASEETAAENATPETAPASAAPPAGPYDQWSSAACPIGVSDSFRAAAGSSFEAEDWQIYAFDGSDKAPAVEVSTIEGAGPEGQNVCRLQISGAPETPKSGIDWRMGKSAPVDQLRGKKITFSAWIRSNVPVNLTNSYLYTHFGPGITIASVTTLDDDWSKYTVEVEVPPDATVAEFWYRLLIGEGTMVPGQANIDIMPSLDMVNG